MTFNAAWIIHRYQTLTSTMDLAARLAHAGARERTAVISDAQTAGRGRGGRKWHSPLGDAIYCTLIVRPDVAPARLATLSLLTGVAVAEAIEVTSGMPARLKWPNDVWLGDDPAHQKVAGTLLSSKLTGPDVEHVLIGIGINVAVPRDALPSGATSLLAAGGLRVSPQALFAVLLERFDDAYARFLASGGRPSLDAWRARAALLNDAVIVEDGGSARQGTFVGIDDDGALLLRESDACTRRIVAGDLVRGPRPAQRP